MALYDTLRDYWGYTSFLPQQAEAISGEMIAELIDKRGGEGRKGLPCVQGCVIACSNVFADPSGRTTVASLQYENIALLGSNCGIGDIDAYLPGHVDVFVDGNPGPVPGKMGQPSVHRRCVGFFMLHFAQRHRQVLAQFRCRGEIFRQNHRFGR